MTGSASELARRLGEHAEAVCREYLSNGHRSGNYWMVGDVRNTRGRSMHVRLRSNAKGPAGKWVDEATSEFGDLLDVIRESRGCQWAPKFPRMWASNFPWLAGEEFGDQPGS